MQCTKGKCPKAFHVSCAREGQHTGIVFTVLKEVEKEVVLVDSAMEAPQEAMQIDTSVLDQVDIAAILSDAAMSPGPVVGGSGESEFNPAHVSDSRVLKVIKKQEVEILCTQHNPVRIFRCYLNLYLSEGIRPSQLLRGPTNRTRLELIYWLSRAWPESRYASAQVYSRCPLFESSKKPTP